MYVCVIIVPTQFTYSCMYMYVTYATYRQQMDEACHHDGVRVLKKCWLGLFGYVRAVKNDRARREFKQSAIASAHYRFTFSFTFIHIYIHTSIYVDTSQHNFIRIVYIRTHFVT